jgi:hypothetical protein
MLEKLIYQAKALKENFTFSNGIIKLVFSRGFYKFHNMHIFYSTFFPENSLGQLIFVKVCARLTKKRVEMLIVVFVFAGICLQKRLQPVHTILEEAARESGF